MQWPREGRRWLFTGQVHDLADMLQTAANQNDGTPPGCRGALSEAFERLVRSGERAGYRAEGWVSCAISRAQRNFVDGNYRAAHDLLCRVVDSMSGDGE